MFQSRFSLSGFILVGALMSSGGAAFAEEDVNSANYVMPDQLPCPEGCFRGCSASDRGLSGLD